MSFNFLNSDVKHIITKNVVSDCTYTKESHETLVAKLIHLCGREGTFDNPIEGTQACVDSHLTRMYGLCALHTNTDIMTFASNVRKYANRYDEDVQVILTRLSEAISQDVQHLRTQYNLSVQANQIYSKLLNVQNSETPKSVGVIIYFEDSDYRLSLYRTHDEYDLYENSTIFLVKLYDKTGIDYETVYLWSQKKQLFKLIRQIFSGKYQINGETVLMKGFENDDEN